ncbi:YncE family protein [Flavobacteriaceae bacterium AH-315-O20]|nr:YncE family protein [Flavobacteriaceae bacterium AH-315-O20]
MKTLKLAVLLITTVLFNACTDDNNVPDLPKGDYEKGYFITNEGPFQNGSGSITFVGDDGVINQNIFKKVNNEDLGNIVNSMALSEENAYIVVNNSHKIIVADRFTMQKIVTIEGQNINNPRYVVIDDNIGYVSNWGDSSNPNDDFIAVIDLLTNTVVDTIAVGEGPENMVFDDDLLFVTLEGGWSQNNKVVVIDTNSNTIVKTITVGYVPNAIVEDDNDNIWVLCGGKPSWTDSETNGGLYKIKAGNLEVTSFEFALTEHPGLLTNEDNTLYYNLNGKVYAMNTNDTALPTESVNGLDGFYYAMQAHDGELFATDAKNFTSEGTLKNYDLTSGALLETVTTGIIPGDIIFD